MQLRDVKWLFAGKVSSQHRSFVSQLSLQLLESIWHSTTRINGDKASNYDVLHVPKLHGAFVLESSNYLLVLMNTSAVPVSTMQ